MMRGPLELRLCWPPCRTCGWACTSCCWRRRRARLKNSPRRTRNILPRASRAMVAGMDGEGAASRTGLPCRQPARPPGMATGGRPTHRRAAAGARAEEIMAGSSAVSVGATPLGPPGQPSRSPPASSAMTWFLTRSCSTCASQSWPGAHRHHQPADQLLPPGRGILVKVDAGQPPESITAEI